MPTTIDQTSPTTKVQQIISSIIKKKEPTDSDFKRLDDAAYESLESRRKIAQSRARSGKK